MQILVSDRPTGVIQSELIEATTWGLLTHILVDLGWTHVTHSQGII